MADAGRIAAASGFGFRTEAAGGGKPVAGAINGMADRALLHLVRRNRRTAGGGHCRVRRIADAIRRLRRLTITIVAFGDTSSWSQRKNARRRAVNVSIRWKKRSRIAGLTGIASTKRLF